MNPFHFGEEAAPLFGVYSPPHASVARKAAVLICGPIGMEYMRTHYTLRLLATQLASSGIHVLRFDYHGLGDSSGHITEKQFDRWIDNIALAAQELYELSDVENLVVVGLRMGAALGMKALSSQRLKARAVVLWDPIVHGYDYLASLQKMHAEMAAERIEPPEPSDELLGSSFPADLRAAIEALCVEQHVDQVDAGAAALIVSQDLPEYLPLHKAMRSHWPEMLYRPMTDPIIWDSLKSAYEGRMTGPIVRAVAEATESLV
jgi:pimeloyl-ACP methyl ester carboxylesterase